MRRDPYGETGRSAARPAFRCSADVSTYHRHV